MFRFDPSRPLSTIAPGGQNYSALTSVVYYGNSSWTARYTYQAPNIGPTNGIPLLRTCDDPMYTGPMHRIGYTYRTSDNYTGNHAVKKRKGSAKYRHNSDREAFFGLMARPLRIEYRGAIYNVHSRGERREAIFYDDADRAEFLRTLGQSRTTSPNCFLSVFAANHQS